MNKFPRIISYYTAPYKKEAARLIASCKRFNLDYEIEEIACRDSWEKNCNYKPTFILEKLKSPLVWVDADAVFVQKPELFKTLNCDLAVWINNKLEKTHPSRVISATIYCSPTNKGIELLKHWQQRCLQNSTTWDQISLRDIIHNSNANIYSLPQSYCKIYDKPGNDAVIMQYQASRYLKKVVNKEVIPFWDIE